MDCAAVIQKVKNSIAFIATFNTKNEYTGSGSGFVYLKKNILVTCNHVVKDTNSLLLKFPNKEKYISGKIILRDDEHDIALIKFDDKNIEPLNIANIENTIEGMPVLFAGYPFGTQDLTTHQGIISAIVQDVTGITTYLIDGTVNPGNSGCPLMNENGNVIGVVNATRREKANLLKKVEEMHTGAISIHGIDLVMIYQALINNVQLGVGFAVPANYIPDHKELKKRNEKNG